MVDMCTLSEQQLHCEFMAFTRIQMEGSSSIIIQKHLICTFVQHMFIYSNKMKQVYSSVKDKNKVTRTQEQAISLECTPVSN